MSHAETLIPPQPAPKRADKPHHASRASPATLLVGLWVAARLPRLIYMVVTGWDPASSRATGRAICMA